MSRPGDDRLQMAPGDRPIEVLRRTMRHPRQEELSVRLAEVVEGRPYLQHGIEVRPGDVVLDIGANIGVAAAFFAVECGAGLVHSFEPIAPIFAYLEQNLRHFPACIPHHYGLGADFWNHRHHLLPGHLRDLRPAR